MASQTRTADSSRRARSLSPMPGVVDSYRQDASGIFRPAVAVEHRGDDYDELGFQTLLTMQQRHFWYAGRQRFLGRAMRGALGARQPDAISAIDLGGGCGGWVRYLRAQRSANWAELALADSSLVALQMAGSVVPSETNLYQIDLLNLQWRNRWDVAFLFDVLEHIDDHQLALEQIYDALRPGGLLLITVPALQAFWSWNDAAVGHYRRYARRDFKELADRVGLELVDSRYFMFLLSPLLLVQRVTNGKRSQNLSASELKMLVMKSHEVPARPINAALAAVFCAETPLGHWLRFPWGTSLLAILRKPA